MRRQRKRKCNGLEKRKYVVLEHCAFEKLRAFWHYWSIRMNVGRVELLYASPGVKL